MKRPRVWNIKTHMLILIAVCIILALATWFIRPVIGYIVGCIALAYGIYLLVRLRKTNRHIRGMLEKIASQLDPAQQEMVSNFPLTCIAVSD